MGYSVYSGTAASLNGDNIPIFNVGDRIQITDLTPAAADVHVNGNQLVYDTSDTITIGNLGPGRYVIRALGSTGTEIRLQEAAHNDFSGDGRSDVLWQNANGTITDWLGASNGSLTGNGSNFNISISSDWHIVGTGDFNGDGRVDILWQNDNGTVTDWLGTSNGSFTGNGANFSTVMSSDWHIVATGDFNGDGRTDILWQNTNGQITDWLGQANGSFTGNGANFNTAISSDWHIVGTGDFNGDGIDDILWRNDNGTVTDWLGQANGSFVGNGANFNTAISSDWHIVGTGDFNGDGIADILWRNDNGTVTDWLGQANGSFVGNGANFNTAISTDWHVVSIGDFNGDATDDILWQNTNGTVTEWLGQANGGFIGNGNNVNVAISSDWHIHDPAVHDIV